METARKVILSRLFFIFHNIISLVYGAGGALAGSG